MCAVKEIMDKLKWVGIYIPHMVSGVTEALTLLWMQHKLLG